jgi:hypothetical protein
MPQRFVPEHNRYSFVPQIAQYHVYVDERTIVEGPRNLFDMIKVEARRVLMYDTIYMEDELDYRRKHILFEKRNY